MTVSLWGQNEAGCHVNEQCWNTGNAELCTLASPTSSAIFAYARNQLTRQDEEYWTHFGLQLRVLKSVVTVTFLADRTNGRTIGTVLHLSPSVVCL